MTPSSLLESINLSEYLPVFSRNAIDEESLKTLCDKDLKELGIAKLGHRKKILDAIAKIPASNSTLSGFAEAFPNVIALPLREYLLEEHPVVRLWTMCDTIELLLRFFALVLIAERKQTNGSLPDDLARRLADIVEKPTMGIWFAISQTLASAEMDNNSIGAPAAALISGQLKSLLYGRDKNGTPETSFLRLRNRLAHGAGMSRSMAKRLLAIWQDPFERMVQEANWLADWELIGRNNALEWRLLRGCGQHALSTPPLEAHDFDNVDADAVWLRTGGKSLLLWPLALFGKPSLERAGKKEEQDHAQIYSSKEAIYLNYTPLGCEGLCESESGSEALCAFNTLFRFNENRKNKEKPQVPDFLKKIRTDATHMVGREEEIAKINQLIEDRPQGVLWISGAAGIGKSFLMAKIATNLLDEPSDTLVLPYRFRANDARCTRESLANFVEERLPGTLNRNLQSNAKAADRLESILGGLKGRRVILILDGLDEIVRRDPGFAAEIPLKLRFPGVLWVLAGRPEADIERAMCKYAAERLYENGLPPMSAGDIRTMILNKIGPLRKRLLVQDQDQGEQVINPFIELVTKRAAGLPLYVKYVIGDVLAGNYRLLDAHENLPASLLAYHEGLLRRLGVGDLQGLLTPLAACLAVAYQPLTIRQIEAILRHGKVPVADSDGHSLVKRGLAAIAAMVIAAPGSNGSYEFTLFHRSLRDHILQSREIAGFVEQTKKNFAELAAAPITTEPLRHYLLRCGVQHLLDNGQNAAAEKLLLDVNHLSEISNAGVGIQELYDYWRTLGGQDRAAGYLESVPAFLDSAQKHETEKVFFVLSIIVFASWVEIGNQVAKCIFKKYVELDTMPPLEIGCSLALLLKNAGYLAEAETQLRLLLEMCDCELSPEHPSTIKIVYSLANLLHSKGNLAEAELLSRRALNVSELTLGIEHPDTLLCLNSLAVLLQDSGDLAEAELLFRRALNAQERMLGPDHLETLASLNNLSRLLCVKGNSTEAEMLCRRSLGAIERMLGSEHPDTLRCLTNLANLLLNKGNLAEAESIYRRTLEASDRTLGLHHPSTSRLLHSLGVLLHYKGDLAEAELISRRALKSMERTLGPEHADTLKCLSHLTSLTLKAKKIKT